MAVIPQSDHGRRGDLREIAAKGPAGSRRQFDKYTPAIVWIRPPDKDAFFDHRFEPAKSGSRWNRGRDAQARYRYAQLRKLGLKQVEEHVPCRIGEQNLSEI